MDRMLQMIFRMVVQKLINKGIRGGTEKLAQRKPDGASTQPPPKMDDSLRKRADLTRRLGRF